MGIKQYKGVVMTWKLTKHLTFDDVESQMQQSNKEILCGQLEEQTSECFWT